MSTRMRIFQGCDQNFKLLLAVQDLQWYNQHNTSTFLKCTNSLQKSNLFNALSRLRLSSSLHWDNRVAGFVSLVLHWDIAFVFYITFDSYYRVQILFCDFQPYIKSGRWNTQSLWKWVNFKICFQFRVEPATSLT